MDDLNQITDNREESIAKLMPVLFLGHGSPLNAIEDNEFVRGWQKIAKTFPKPESILCVSAHWLTGTTIVNAGKKPETIHDFGGFPKILYEIEYPAPGNPALADEIIKIVKTTDVQRDPARGLDHGCWSVLKHLYPDADVPVVQLSIDLQKNVQFHFDLGRELMSLRSKGVLIIGSGNIVHNLGLIDWDNPDGGYLWAKKANDLLVSLINQDEQYQLINYKTLGQDVGLSIPTIDHYLPLIYVLGLRSPNDKITTFNNKLVMGSISMASFIIENK